MYWTTKAIKKLIDENPDGFTVNVETGEKIKSGYAVALTHGIKLVDASLIANNWIKDAEYGLEFGCATHTLGGWKSPSGEYVVDIGLIVNNNNLGAAKSLALEYTQYSIFDIDNGKEIAIKK